MSSEELKRKVWLTLSDNVSKVCDLLPSNRGRQSLVTSLIKAYLLHTKCEIIEIGNVLEKDLEAYHDSKFIKCLLRDRKMLDKTSSRYSEICNVLKSWTMVEENIYDVVEFDSEFVEDSTEDIEELEACGLKYDCYPFPFMAQYVKLTAGSSIYTARALIRAKSNGSHNVAINWYGGRHHCTKDKAAGYCYINDIILAIGHLRKTFGKVFYLDLDLHHGDGVESGYRFSRYVFTCSVHRYDVGFFPGTGSLKSCQPNMINIPTKHGLNDRSMLFILKQIVIPLIQKFQPNVVVIQSGCDGLGSDEHKEWNLTIKGFGEFFNLLLKNIAVPVMILGGGGYNHTEAAKCWTYITKTIVKDLNEWDLIPEHEFLDEYEKDGFLFWTTNNSNCKNMKDENDEEYLESLKEYITSI